VRTRPRHDPIILIDHDHSTASDGAPVRTISDASRFDLREGVSGDRMLADDGRFAGYIAAVRLHDAERRC
jgi:hypothetical protein